LPILVLVFVNENHTSLKATNLASASALSIWPRLTYLTTSCPTTWRSCRDYTLLWRHFTPSITIHLVV